MPEAGDRRQASRGRIVTFYSFKGGTGRTMALANVAWILAANGMRILAASGASQIHASTDLGNVPMAKAFHRAGWVTYSHQIDMTWPG